MHVHMPKPLHGWREFVGEVVIIVVGVLIALGAEQLVQSVRETQLRRETSDAANGEIAQALKQFVNRRLLEPCIDRRLGEVSAILSASAKPAYRAPSWIGRPESWGFNSVAWDAASAGGRVALMNRREQTRFSSLYIQLRELASLERDEQKEWAEIRQLEDLPEIDAQTRDTVRSALAQARLLNWNINVDLEQTISRATSFGIVGQLAPKGASPSICLPLTTPRSDAIRQVNAFFRDNLGEP